MLTKEQDFRLTVAGPLWLALITYPVVLAMFYSRTSEMDSVNFLAIANAACACLAIYVMAITSRIVPIFNTRITAGLNKLLTAALPPFIAASFGYMSANRWASSLPVQLFFAILGVMFLPPIIAGGLMESVFQLIRLCIINPLKWLFNVPKKEQSAAAPAYSNELRKGTAESAQVPTNPEEDNALKAYDVEHPSTTLDSLAGMAEFKAEVERFILPFRTYHSDQGPVSDTNGMLFTGPAGNGKTHMAEVVAGELKLPLIKVSGQDIQSRFINQSGEQVKALFAQARNQPCVLFIDELDSLGQSRAASNGHKEDNKVVTALLTEIVAIRKHRVLLIAATNYPEMLDAALIRDGRFDARIDVPYPDYEARVAILNGMLKKFGVTSDGATVDHVARLWERRSVAFIESTVKRVRNAVADGVATIQDFKLASREASRKNSNILKTGAKLSEIALTSEVRREANSLVYRLRNWEEIAEKGGEPPSGVLLYGPPGTGKTNFGRALARELEYWHMFEVNATDVLHDPRKFRDVVELAANHRPAIIFIDEADELLRDRTYSNAAGATNEILKAMDGMMGKVPEIVFMAATNNAEVIDGAALRGGRFGEKIFMGPLSGADLVAFLEKDFKSKDKVTFDADLTPSSLAARVKEATPADILGILRKAINYTFANDGSMRPVTMMDIDRAILSTNL